jgi:hypothetical protein
MERLDVGVGSDGASSMGPTLTAALPIRRALVTGGHWHLDVIGGRDDLTGAPWSISYLTSCLGV